MVKRKTSTKTRPLSRGVEYKTTGINVPSPIWELLNRVAFERAKEQGGRPSVSALLVDLVKRHQRELERELPKTLVRHAS